ncbi:unnamed protein product [Vitrella brassicaformis CCMP3155]|uniref:Mediator of RNA polymerase II transcription subunit 20 n=1 Tax=Vitrella brassicaformis (strain CCMP3155) TaxID=1169540 RepID=A0A0G4FSN6_VITBC|nr:unnamed protein product [Vitrella brassicaformis CCMP3155]|mmetsp:Transcript_20733/g.50583  ORF Transcript_20733/g.50583 Transcript_20733/m.50583 type:complete len:324 (-) Transcript_20733:2368-3339(-)|eukprot:CEM17296.1 unnamed protein product [Vitrella brassicaformis CCMP3155]
MVVKWSVDFIRTPGQPPLQPSETAEAVKKALMGYGAVSSGSWSASFRHFFNRAAVTADAGGAGREFYTMELSDCPGRAYILSNTKKAGDLTPRTLKRRRIRAEVAGDPWGLAADPFTSISRDDDASSGPWQLFGGDLRLPSLLEALGIFEEKPSTVVSGERLEMPEGPYWEGIRVIVGTVYFQGVKGTRFGSPAAPLLLFEHTKTDAVYEAQLTFRKVLTAFPVPLSIPSRPFGASSSDIYDKHPLVYEEEKWPAFLLGYLQQLQQKTGVETPVVPELPERMRRSDTGGATGSGGGGGNVVHGAAAGEGGGQGEEPAAKRVKR